MKLSILTTQELSDLFVEISQEYLNAATGLPTDFIDNFEFLKVRQKLHDVIDELATRRKITLAVSNG